MCAIELNAVTFLTVLKGKGGGLLKHRQRQQQNQYYLLRE